MGFDRTAWGDKFSDTATTAQYTLGTLRYLEHPTYGIIQCRYVKNSDTANTVQGSVMQMKASDLTWNDAILTATAKLPRGKILGVCDHAIAASSYGWIIAQGRCKVLCDGSVAANDTIMADGTAGRAKTATLATADDGAAAFGVALEADGAANSLANCRISCI